MFDAIEVRKREIAYEYCADQKTFSSWLSCMNETEKKIDKKVKSMNRTEAILFLSKTYEICLYNAIKDFDAPTQTFKKCINKKMGWENE